MRNLVGPLHLSHLKPQLSTQLIVKDYVNMLNKNQINKQTFINKQSHSKVHAVSRTNITMTDAPSKRIKVQFDVPLVENFDSVG